MFAREEVRPLLERRPRVAPAAVAAGVSAAERVRADDDPAGPRYDIGILVEERYLCQTQPSGLAEALRGHGHAVRVIDPQAASYQVGDDRWLDGMDMLVARGRSWELLCLLSWAEARGVPTINNRSAIAAVHNKAEMGVALETARVPAPRTFLGPQRTLASRLLLSGAGFPIVVKPLFGDNSRGVRLVRDETELRGLEWPEPVMLAQELVQGDGYDRKVYGIGEEVWVVKKPSLWAGDGTSRIARGPEPTPTSELPPVSLLERELAERCRRVFGLELYGIDCIQTRGGPVVIEVNEFPNYTGVPEASDRLAEYVLRRARALKARGRRSCE